MAGGLFGLGAVTGPLLGPTVGGYLIDVVELALDLPRQRAGRPHRRGARLALHRGAGLRAPQRADRRLRHRAPRRRHGLAAVRARGGQPRRLVREPPDHASSPPSRPSRSSRSSSTSSRRDNPVVDLRVFKNRSYAAGTGINFLLGLALFSGAYLFSLYCGAVMHYTALDIGLMFLVAGRASRSS